MAEIIEVASKFENRRGEDVCLIKGRIQLDGEEGAWEILLDERHPATVDEIVKAVFPATDEAGDEFSATPPQGRRQRREFWQKRAKAAGVINIKDQEREARALLLGKIKEEALALVLKLAEPTRLAVAPDFIHDPRFGTVGFNRRRGTIKFEQLFIKAP